MYLSVYRFKTAGNILMQTRQCERFYCIIWEFNRYHHIYVFVVSP